jgi:hypothetical protein
VQLLCLLLLPSLSLFLLPLLLLGRPVRRNLSLPLCRLLLRLPISSLSLRLPLSRLWFLRLRLSLLLLPLSLHLCLCPSLSNCWQTCRTPFLLRCPVQPVPASATATAPAPAAPAVPQCHHRLPAFHRGLLLARLPLPSPGLQPSLSRLPGLVPLHSLTLGSRAPSLLAPKFSFSHGIGCLRLSVSLLRKASVRALDSGDAELTALPIIWLS